MKRKKKLTLDLSAQEGSSTKKLRINTSGSQVIQEKVPPQEEFDNNFQPPIKSTFNYVASSDPFEGFKKKSGKEKSPINNDNDVKDLYATALSTSASKVFNDQEKRISKAVQKKKGKQVTLKIVKKEAEQSSTNSMK
ncbi:hypothetical protein G6F29_007919 [Rhizopus arrhizus]|nr:hypothetical protein G6F23_005550 [Rhizopus arrhizus]KAG1413182.1 hypothetical protein G6F58_007634 [Rhizopus delemar]KAG0763832.1 hypothetical protein G6F24_005709 [Rhizopus arrhizus]KAG0793667.1 hypothetical protein G6F22_005545 [Rhizopus arrhizus]KAG0853312.1 hypothetical protein G6F17_007334 [Rhizopus arrhizus]